MKKKRYFQHLYLHRNGSRVGKEGEELKSDAPKHQEQNISWNVLQKNKLVLLLETFSWG